MTQNASISMSLGDLLVDLGTIPATRVRSNPPSGTATISHWQAANQSGHTSCELVDGTLVERAMGWQESMLAAALIEILRAFVMPRNLGVVTGPDGFIELFPLTVRGPDVSFVSWTRLPGGRLPVEAVPRIAPDLVVEILSEGNTRAEMARKRREYFQAGVSDVWMIDPRERSVAVYVSSVSYEVKTDDETIVCRGELFGLTIPLAPLFGELDRVRDAKR